ncbi:MAG: DUF2283 domain-containing protein [Chloroflexi bacterium]|nr:DUF2283 domain-containing protein [Chloroflexota bacterium]
MAEKLVLDKVRFNYDSEGDVLYISFGEPEAADDSDVTEEGIIVRLRQDKIVGLTILNAQEKLYLR